MGNHIFCIFWFYLKFLSQVVNEIWQFCDVGGTRRMRGGGGGGGGVRDP